MSTETITFHVEREHLDTAGEWQELPVLVEYEYTPASRGSRERGTGLQMEPDEPARIVIISTSIPLTPEETARAFEDCEADVMAKIMDAKDERDERRWEDMKERRFR